jgi:hypothetical protein
MEIREGHNCVTFEWMEIREGHNCVTFECPRGALTLLSRLSRETESPEVVLGSKAIASALAYSLGVGAISG